MFESLPIIAINYLAEACFGAAKSLAAFQAHRKMEIILLFILIKQNKKIKFS